MSLEDDEENGSSSGSDNDVDETMEDVDAEDDNGEGDDADADADEEGDDDGDGEGEGDGDDNEDEGEGDEEDDNGEPDSPSQRDQQLPNGVPSREGQGPTVVLTSPSPHPASGATSPAIRLRPSVRPEAITTSFYDIEPTIAAPHSTSINTITATPDMRWVFTGGSDGYIRKFQWPDTVNGKLMLTVAQRHPFVDSVVKAGLLMSYWENEDRAQSNFTQRGDESGYLSPCYSLAVHHQGLWLLSGTESGAINLQTVRHREGTNIHTLRGHSNAVSVLVLASDERSVLSGSWDKTINDWDLNTGQVRRKFESSGGQISAIELRPESSLPVPQEYSTRTTTSGTYSSNNASKPVTNGALTNGVSTGGPTENSNGYDAVGDAKGSPDSLFGDGDDASLFGDSKDQDGPEAPSGAAGIGGLGDDDDDEFSRAIANGIQDMQEEEDAAQEQSQQEQQQQSEQHQAENQSQTNAQQSGSNDVDMTDAGGPVQPTNIQSETSAPQQSNNSNEPQALTNGVAESQTSSSTATLNGHPNSDAATLNGTSTTSTTITEPDAHAPSFPKSDTTFLDASIDGPIRVWDRRQPNPIARIVPPKNTPPWCMNACWSPDGNCIYAGRRNGTVDEYSLAKGLREPSRTFRLPPVSGPVSSVKAMPNGRHLVCASHDILRLYDLHHDSSTALNKHGATPFFIVPGHRTGVVSQLYVDPTCQFMITTGGNRGWEGSSTEVMLGYEIGLK